MENNQPQLFQLHVRWNVGNSDRPLSQIVEMIEKNEILIPKFQREFCWKPDKISSWGQTVINGDAVGCIVTYQVRGFGPIYIADGLQRATATKKLLDDLSLLKANMDREQFRKHVEACSVTVQHRYYETHEEALEAFQALNMGTVATPYEYYRGELALNPIGDRVYKEIPGILIAVDRSFFREPRERLLPQKLKRDAFALFYQYASETQQVDFAGIGASKISPHDIPIERKLLSYLTDMKITDNLLDQRTRSFSTFLDQHTAELKTVLGEIGQANKQFSPTLFRNLIHWNLWRKNTKRESAVYWRFVRQLLEHLAPQASFASRIELPNTNPVDVVTLRFGSSKGLDDMSKAFGVPFYQKQQRKKSVFAAPGFHESHIDPFSKHGNGQTFIESASRNLARGAKSIDEGDW